MAVSVERFNEVAVVTIDNPPVNATSHGVRASLVDAIAETDADSTIRAVVLRGAGRTFTAGADVREFGKPPVAPVLPDVILALEAAKKPWTAALHGTVLGGGLEMALGCAYRVAQSGTSLGLPEVMLGLIPGAGGTVRLPRLIDPLDALTMIAGGKPVPAEKALKLGLVDEVVTDDLVQSAITFARARLESERPVPLSERAPKLIADVAAWEKAQASIKAKAKGANAPVAAIEAVQAAMDLPASEALTRERGSFLTLKADPQSAALRHIFFAERSTAKIPEIKGVEVAAPTSIGVIGGGTMGAGIAAACLLSGLNVTLIERDKEACDAGRDRVESTLEGSRKRGLINQATLHAHLARLAADTSYEALAEADLVIEAVFEDMDVKHRVFAKLDAVVKSDTVLASNTSYLDINVIAAATEHPERLIGLHFFSPAHVMKLLEVIIPQGASAEAVARGFSLGKRLGKIAVPAGVCEGFIGNRIMSAYRRSCEYMIEDGALPWDVDAAMRAFGFPMGIFEMQDLAGLDISWAMRKRQAATRDPALRYVDVGDKLCEAGRFGRKTGEGWYDYVDGKAEPSAWVEALILSSAADKGINRRPFLSADIGTRIVEAMQTEASVVLADGIARRPEDVDVVMVHGYGFPRWRGGPMHMATHAASKAA